MLTFFAVVGVLASILFVLWVLNGTRKVRHAFEFIAAHGTEGALSIAMTDRTVFRTVVRHYRVTATSQLTPVERAAKPHVESAMHMLDLTGVSV